MDKPDPKAEPETAEDVVLLHGRTEDGGGYRALRARDGHLEQAEIRPVKEGQPLQGAELVTLRPRREFPLLCDVEVLYRREEGAADPKPASPAAHGGPARVSTRSYRQNWDKTFRSTGGKKRDVLN